MQAFTQRLDVQFHIFTTTPAWFFEQSLSPDRFTWHPVVTDVGLVQRSALDIDWPATEQTLHNFFADSPQTILALAGALHQAQCRAVFCDIAPLGTQAAARAGLPSILVENFTWDWIYAAYGENPALQEHAERCASWFAEATYHIQAEPICAPTAKATLAVPPIARPFREDPLLLRQRLGLPEAARLTLVTMGGLGATLPFVEKLRATDEVFLLPSSEISAWRHDGNLCWFPMNSGVYHPDLLRACDGVVSKVGYSTLAEAYHAELDGLFAGRDDFRESATLVHFAKTRLSGRSIEAGAFLAGDWVEAWTQRPQRDRPSRSLANGADRIADWFLTTILPDL
jgi:hypothetical protein